MGLLFQKPVEVEAIMNWGRNQLTSAIRLDKKALRGLPVSQWGHQGDMHVLESDVPLGNRTQKEAQADKTDLRHWRNVEIQPNYLAMGMRGSVKRPELKGVEAGYCRTG
jgi:hypothetical protein